MKQRSEQAQLGDMDFRVKTFSQLATEHGEVVEEVKATTEQAPLVRERRPMKSKKEVKKELDARRSGRWLEFLD